MSRCGSPKPTLAPSRVVLVPPPSPTLPPAALPTHDNNMSTSEKVGYSGRLRSSTRPNLDDRETGHARDPDTRGWGNLRRRVPVVSQRTGHQTSTRAHQERGRLAGSGRGGGGPTSTGLGGVSTAALASSGGAPPAGLPALDRAPPPPPGLSTLDRAPPPEIAGLGRPCRPLGLGIRGAMQAQRALEDARQTILRRVARQHRHDEDIEQAKNAAREASVVAERVHQALAHSVAPATAGALPRRLCFDAPAECNVPASTARDRRLFQGQRRVHGV